MPERGSFPGTTASRDDADYVLLGAPLDVSTTFQPGTRFGPGRVRTAARQLEDYDRSTNSRFSDLGVHDAGDVRAWPDAVEYLDHLGGRVADVVDEDAVPLLLGGEHTVSIAGVRAIDPEVYVCLDAHLDLRDEYDGDPLNHACVSRRALATADRAVVLGARSGSEAEWQRAEMADVDVVPPADVAGWLESADPGSWGRTYLSVDIDAADPSVAPGTGTMVPGGLSAAVLEDVVRSLAPHAAGLDVVEVNDRDDGQAAVLAGRLVRGFVYAAAVSGH